MKDRTRPGRNESRTRPKRRAILWALLTLTTITTLVVSVRGAWRETRLREATIPELQAMARRSPEDPRVLTVLGARYAEAWRYREAADTLADAGKRGVAMPEVWLTAAACAVAAGDRTESNRLLGAAYKLTRGTSDFPKIQGAFERCKAAGEAATEQELARAISPDGPAPLLKVAITGSVLDPIRRWQGRTWPGTSGYATRQEWARTEPDSGQARTLWGRALLENGILRQAETEADAAVKLAPRSAQAHLLLADIYYAGGVKGRAGQQYQRALALRKDWLPALLGLGNVALDQKLIDIGVTSFTKATQADPKSVAAWIGLGKAYYEQRFRMDKSLEAFETAARLAPKRTDFYYSYANALRTNYRFDAAEDLLRRRVAAAPTDPQAKYLLGVVVLENKRSPEREAEAEKLFRTALEIQSDALTVKTRLAQLLLEKGGKDNASDAGELLVEVLQADPLDAQSMRLLGRAYQAVGRVDEADLAAKKAVELAKYADDVARLQDQVRVRPGDASLHKALIALYQKAGQTEKADRQREFLMALETRGNEAKRAIGALQSATSNISPAGNADLSDQNRERSLGQGTPTPARVP